MGREKVIKAITDSHSDLKDLYDDFQKLKDVHSLEKISEYIKLALSSNPEKKEGQLIVVRMLQVMGEYLKNTLESPNLSDKTSKMFLMSMQKNVREVIIDLRNSLSHAHSLSKRTELEQITDANFFKGVQNNARRINSQIDEILYKFRFEIAKTLLERVSETKNMEELLEITELAKNIGINEEMRKNVHLKEQSRLQNLLKEFKVQFSGSAGNNISVVDKINIIIKKLENSSARLKKNYEVVFKGLRTLGHSFVCLIDQHTKNANPANIIRKIHEHCKSFLGSLDMNSTDVEDLKKEVDDLFKNFECNRSISLAKILCELRLYIETCNTGDFLYIDQLRQTICKKDQETD